MGMGEGRLVLIAEDDAAQREILEEVLVDEGYRVLLAQSPEELVARLAQGPDAVLMDLVGVMSPRVMRTLAALPTRPALMLVSGDNSLPQVAARLHADAFVRKPYELATLLTLLASLTQPRAQAKEMLVRAVQAHV